MSEPSELPPVILGDHGFMALYGSQLSDADIVSRMLEALEAGIPMLSGGDLRLGKLVVQAFATHGTEPRWIKHLDAPLAIGAQPLPFPRAMSSLQSAVLARLGDKVLEDGIMGPFLRTYAGECVLDASQIRLIQLDAAELRLHLEAIVRQRPSIVTIGGDVTDFLLTCGRLDLFHELLDKVGVAAAAAGAGIVACTYVGFAWPDAFRTIATRSDVVGLMLPANIAGIGMLPSPDECRANSRALGKPVLAMHALAIGTLPMRSALHQLLHRPEISAVIVGASSSKHIGELAAIRREIVSGMLERAE